jgi:hypothetical protein
MRGRFVRLSLSLELERLRAGVVNDQNRSMMGLN